MNELPKVYDPKLVDHKWYQFWLEGNYFYANPNSSKPSYCLVIPPPNVTGSLHMGHALVNTLQDVLIRWKRMSGFETLWVPGTDHAGIATQTVVERHLLKTEGKKRVDFAREDFLQRVWDWKKLYEGNILGQLKKLGCSCDWSRLRFTMDEGNNKAVRTMFKRLFDKGLIYRGDYLVNWDPVTETAIADDEVEYEEKNSFIWTFKYPSVDGTFSIEIATTRPETMLGDTAVAVSPKDSRYAHLVGKEVFQPLTGRKIPIIADSYVDPAFGTGAVKITPAHDPNDYKIGLTHKLPFINIMTSNGFVNENGGDFKGLSFPEAREAVTQAMKQKGLFVKQEPHLNRVGISYRSKAVIEPYLSKQWFVKMDGFGKVLLDLIQNKKVKIVPSHWENTYFHWIENLRDWCISRQLWWGHRIPIWYKKTDRSQMICHEGEGIPKEVQESPDQWEQDPDVLDTWFSSALWPFATLGWPEKTPELKKFYPNSSLITGHDILFFWVARMLAMGTEAMGEPPFPETFLHGLIYGKSYWRKNKDGSIHYVTPEERIEYDLGKPTPKDVEFKWEKMSKSKGNVIDPIELIDSFGTDATRMTLCAYATQAREIDLDRKKFEEFRNFTNKVWNGARFVLMNLSDLSKDSFAEGLKWDELDLEDRWILQKLSDVITQVNDNLEKYQFDQAAAAAYDFFWKEFCAYYVEISKPYLFGKLGTPEQRLTKQKILLITLTQAIRILHPMAPFITEELFQLVKEQFSTTPSGDALSKECLEALQAPSCVVAPYPKALPQSTFKQEDNEKFNRLMELIYTLRNIRGEMKLPPQSSTDVIVVGKKGGENFELFKQYYPIASSLVKVKEFSFVETEPKLAFASMAQLGDVRLLLPLPEEMVQAEKARLIKEEEKLTLSIQKLEQQLNNADFVDRAPPALIAKHREQLATATRDLAELKSKL